MRFSRAASKLGGAVGYGIYYRNAVPRPRGIPEGADRRIPSGHRAQLIGFAETEKVHIRRHERQTGDFDDPRTGNESEIHRVHICYPSRPLRVMLSVDVRNERAAAFWSGGAATAAASAVADKVLAELYGSKPVSFRPGESGRSIECSV